ncbi:MAG TPA: pyridoxamine 5'-phosphate oxidase [Verrucomicrobiae bacterium]|jgi:pyridoxamine 5'-phosphate oxidase|nr:pyridoxamine 5'-phosphate oxidase [Verrucomicrobiae bacterium]
MNPADIRRNYSGGSLERTGLDADPLRQFQDWFARAAEERSGSRWRKISIALYKLWHAFLGHQPVDVNAMVLATADQDGKPSARTVLLKGVDERGFIFYTNYDSRKGRDLTENPNAALTFFWPDLERQVCVAGTVSKLSVAESESYFKSRPRGSRLAAWASNQSDVVPDRTALEKKWDEMAAKFPTDIPLPPNWGGYVLKPERIEFWQGRLNRLHDRFCYTRQPDNSWKLERLSP